MLSSPDPYDCDASGHLTPVRSPGRIGVASHDPGERTWPGTRNHPDGVMRRSRRRGLDAGMGLAVPQKSRS
jgi:hypothetical protein